MPITPFLQKTYDICCDPTLEGICGWGENNDSLFITNIEEFSRVVLPKHFKHSNYSSFTRQLHKYDFHKTVHNPRHGEFKHQYFIKGEPERMALIKRKVYVSKKATANAPSPPSPPSTVYSADGTTDGETDNSSDKDGDGSRSGSSDTDFDFDFDFLNEENGDDNNIEYDFEQFDEIEASVERGMIAFDDERISVLEKRQAHLMEDNETTKNEIINTLRENECMVEVIDTLLNHVQNIEDKPVPDEAEIDELCAGMRAKCQLQALSNEVQAAIKASCMELFVSPAMKLMQNSFKKQRNSIGGFGLTPGKKDENATDYTDLE